MNSSHGFLHKMWSQYWPELILQHQLSVDVESFIPDLVIKDITETVPLLGGQQLLARRFIDSQRCKKYVQKNKLMKISVYWFVIIWMHLLLIISNSLINCFNGKTHIQWYHQSIKHRNLSTLIQINSILL